MQIPCVGVDGDYVISQYFLDLPQKGCLCLSGFLTPFAGKVEETCCLLVTKALCAAKQ